jgi:putative transposase
MIQFVAQRMMEFDVESLCGAGFDVTSPDRINSRNGTATACGEPVPATLI